MIRRTRTLWILMSAFAIAGSSFGPATPAMATGEFALHFTGPATAGRNYVLTSGSTFLPKNFTFSVDVRWDGTNGYGVAVSRPTRDHSPTDGTGIALGLSDGKPLLGLGTIAGNRAIFAPTAVTPNVWTTIAGSYDGQTLTLYADGTIVATQDFGTTGDLFSPESTALIIGREFIVSTDGFLVTRGFHGDIDNVVYSEGTDPGSLTMLSRYTFSEGSGTSTADSGTGGFTGTLSALDAPTWVAGVIPAPEVPSDAALPNTGIDSGALAGMLAGLVALVAAGIALIAIRRRTAG